MTPEEKIYIGSNLKEIMVNVHNMLLMLDQDEPKNLRLVV